MKWLDLLIYILNQVIGSLVDRLHRRKLRKSEDYKLHNSRETLNQDQPGQGEQNGKEEESNPTIES